MGKTMGISHQLVVCIVDLALAKITFATEGLPDVCIALETVPCKAINSNKQMYYAKQRTNGWI